MKQFNKLREETLEEKLKASDPTGKWISDFVHSDNPKFAGKSKKERIRMALGASYAAKRNEEVEQIDEKVLSTELQTVNGNHVVNSQTHQHPNAKYGVQSDTLVHKGTIETNSYGAKKKKFEVHNHPNRGLIFQTKHTDDEKQAIKKHLIKNGMAGKGTDIHEEVEQIDEGKMDKMSLSALWHKHAQHTYWADQGYGAGSDNPKHAHHAATAIENHVRKHHGNKVADDMVAHSDHHVAHAEYVGGKEAKETEHAAEKLRKKHGIKGNLYGMQNESVEQVEEADVYNQDVKRAFPGGKARGVVTQPKTSFKDVLKKAGTALHKGLTGGSDQDQLDRLRKSMYKEDVVEDSLEEVEQVDEMFPPSAPVHTPLSYNKMKMTTDKEYSSNLKKTQGKSPSANLKPAPAGVKEESLADQIMAAAKKAGLPAKLNTTSVADRQKATTKLLKHRADQDKKAGIKRSNNLDYGHLLPGAKNEATEQIEEEKPGLYANIHAKRKRIAAGSGERMRKPGSKGAPTAQAFKDAAKTAKK